MYTLINFIRLVILWLIWQPYAQILVISSFFLASQQLETFGVLEDVHNSKIFGTFQRAEKVVQIVSYLVICAFLLS
jgi:hypothetical protein